MQLQTHVDIAQPDFTIEPQELMLFVGSCFAESIGRRFVEDKFRATVNPFGVMYNPVSVLHTVERTDAAPRVAFITLGTNRVYVLNSTGEIVDNCQKRPQRLFTERQLSIDECAEALQRCVDMLAARNEEVRIVLTVSPIRYAKYGFHGSQLSKATLLLAAERVVESNARCSYFPAYEIVNDELRDYRFYAPDMLHPSQQAVDYIWERLADAYFSPATRRFLSLWQPIKEALGHRPFHPESPEYAAFMAKTRRQLDDLRRQYPLMED